MDLRVTVADLERKLAVLIFIRVDDDHIKGAHILVREYLAGRVHEMLRVKIVVSDQDLGVATVQDELRVFASGNCEIAIPCFDVDIESCANC